MAFITAHGAEGAEIPWQALAQSALTLVVYMGVARAASLQASLLAGGLRLDTPVIAVENASRANTRSVCTTIVAMVDDFARQSLKSPAVLVIGEAMRSRALALARSSSAQESAAFRVVA